jgi:hypothetical protein
MYAALNDASSILEGKPKPSMLLYTEWIPASEPVDGPTIDIDGTEQMHNLTHRANFDKFRAIINEAINKAATKQDKKIRFWTKADTALKMAFLQTLSHEVYDVSRLQQNSMQRFHTATRKTASTKPVRVGLSSSSCAMLTAPTQSTLWTGSVQL